jgi:hypothetical protein
VGWAEEPAYKSGRSDILGGAVMGRRVPRFDGDGGEGAVAVLRASWSTVSKSMISRSPKSPCSVSFLSAHLISDIYEKLRTYLQPHLLLDITLRLLRTWRRWNSNEVALGRIDLFPPTLLALHLLGARLRGYLSFPCFEFVLSGLGLSCSATLGK